MVSKPRRSRRRKRTAKSKSTVRQIRGASRSVSADRVTHRRGSKQKATRASLKEDASPHKSQGRQQNKTRPSGSAELKAWEGSRVSVTATPDLAADKDLLLKTVEEAVHRSIKPLSVTLQEAIESRINREARKTRRLLLRECARCSGYRGSCEKDQGALHADMHDSLPTDKPREQDTSTTPTASSGNERTPLFNEKELDAELEALEQLSLVLETDKPGRIHRTGVEELLLAMLKYKAYQDADEPQPFRWKNTDLSQRTLRKVRPYMLKRNWISARIRIVSKKVRGQPGVKREEEYWEQTLLTPWGLAVARRFERRVLDRSRRPDPAKDSNESVEHARGDSTPSATTT
jgi:hypothetical protein